MAELQGFRATDRVPKRSYSLHVEPTHKLARGIRSVQSFKLVQHKAHICAPGLGKPRGHGLQFRTAEKVRVVLNCLLNDSPIRKNDQGASIGHIETHDHVAVARKIFGKDCESKSPGINTTGYEI
jgi:hypothetical protein